MTLSKQTLAILSNWNDDNIKSKFFNLISAGQIALITEIRNSLSILTADIGQKAYPQWFITTVDNIINTFNSILLMSVNQSEIVVFTNQLTGFYNYVYYKQISKEQLNLGYSIPDLENYITLKKLERTKLEVETADSKINSIRELNDQELSKLKTQFGEFKSDADATLSLLKREAGKIGVKQYAEIFDIQAKEHSSFFSKLSIVNSETNETLKKSYIFGKAQWWLLFAIISFVALGWIYFDKHLYTLNRHRANTLKSFEYLTRGADPLAPDSYNAILMEVAKSIYEAGQTGYINSNDNNAELPSIIDMSKIFTQPKG